ncbi:hypothetical protein [Hydrogenimonas sp. SS33]|uniref:hypothetical protein n=1 Tax=Hydrogenimonas leucolamina TaxID=2954236 RepID=UPI00336BC8E4
MWHVNEWFIKEPKENDPLCRPSFPSMCIRRYRLLKKRRSGQYAKDLHPQCSRCLEVTGGGNSHVNRLNALIATFM